MFERLKHRLTELRRGYLMAFYRLMSKAVDREIVIANSTGRNPMNVLALRRTHDEYQRAITRLDLGL